MQQYTYRIPDSGTELEKLLKDIQEEHIVGDLKRTLILFLTKVSDLNTVQKYLSMVREAFPGYPLMGSTMLGPVTEDVIFEDQIQLSVLTFETSFVSLHRYMISKPDASEPPLSAADASLPAKEAGRLFADDLSAVEDAKGVLCYCAGVHTYPDLFLSMLPGSLNHVPIFGMPAGGCSIKQLGEDRVFFGDQMLVDAVVTCTFSGEDLHIHAGSSFGWFPIGHEMEVTSGDGFGLVTEIDHKNPQEVYARYLHLHDAKPSYADFCAFPLVTGTGTSLTSRVPNVFDEHGFRFKALLQPGDKVSLAYARERDLLSQSLRLANDFIRFVPQGLISTVCLNRRVLLGNELADRELYFFQRACTKTVIQCGAGEFLRLHGKGGHRNSTCVLAAFREGNVKNHAPLISDPEIEHLPVRNAALTDHLLSFLEETSKDLQYAATMDQMTDLFNRPTIEKMLKAAAKEWHPGLNLVVFMFDIDNFKNINDQYGHDAGDEVLCKAASVMKSTLAKEGIGGRWGGDEFFCYSTKSSLSEFMEYADLIRRKIAEESFGKVKRITISGGIAEMRSEITDFHDLYQRVDRAMYHSKHFGGNRITAYKDEYQHEISAPENYYQFSPEKRAALERLEFPLGIYQLPDPKKPSDYHPVLLSDGLCRMFRTNRSTLMNYLGSKSYRRVHPDDAGRLIRAASSFARMTEQSVICRMLVGGQYHEILFHEIKHIMEDGTPLFYVHYTDLSTIRDNNRSAYQQYIESQKDMFMRDAVTGLPNIHYYQSFAHGTLEEIRNKDLVPAILFMDIQGMHSYNDRYGYVAGDDLLRKTGELLRRTFSGQTMCVRYTEDHFVVVTGEEDIIGLIGDMRQEFMKQVSSDLVDLKAGIYYYEDPKENEVSAVDKARAAVDYIHDDPQAYACVYDENIRELNHQRDYILDHYQEALEKGWIEVWYQPLIRTLSGKICGYEALARWRDPVYGLLSPAQFIKTLEERHLLVHLDLYVVGKVCRQIRKSLVDGRSDVFVSVNLSRHDLEYPEIHAKINEICDGYGVPHGNIHIEITESALVRNEDAIQDHIRRFHEDGYSVWLDDFGSGYSSLNVLQKFDFDCLKIDLMFLRNTNERTKILLNDIVDMAKRLRMETLTEGVETEEQFDYLHSIGCGIVQGYYCSKPRSFDELEEEMQKRSIELENAEDHVLYRSLSLVNVLDVATPQPSQGGEGEDCREGQIRSSCGDGNTLFYADY